MKKHFTKLIKKSDVEISIDLAKKELISLIEQLLLGKLTFLYKQKICTASPIDFHRLLTEWNRKSTVDNYIRQIIISFFFSAEEKMIGAGLLSCAQWLDLLEQQQTKQKLRADDIYQIIDNWLPTGVSNNISKKIFQAGALGSEVVFEESDRHVTQISILNGNMISGHIDYIFQTKNNLVNYHDKCSIIAIDGIVESISQIDSLLVRSSKQKIILAAKGFLQDVSNTLSENYFSKKLNVIPYVVKDWKIQNFLDLEKSNISCISYEIGSDIRKLIVYEEQQIFIDKNDLLYSGLDKNPDRKIKVSFGKDLDALRGISLDRTKMMLSIMRNSSRTGTKSIKLFGKVLQFPQISLKYSQKSVESLSNILQNLGGVIINVCGE